MQSVNGLEEKLKASGEPYELFRYPSVGHAFMNATTEGIARRLKLGQGEHDQEAVDLAWSRLLGFFDKQLR
jgi:dienelactone hydrolase